MPESLVNLLDALEGLARYNGAWRPLREEKELLSMRVAELRERQSHLDDVLVVALVGGSGVGKSTLLNALAGDELAKTSEFRPCTNVPAVYHPPGVRFDSEDAHHVSGSALEKLILVDTPDSDTIVHEHRERVIAVLRQCDLILLCGSAEKYLDDATWSLLRPLRGERTFVCVETKAGEDGSVKEHWLARLAEENFQAAGYFRVRALRSFDRKLATRDPDQDELDFPALEAFLHDELDTDRIARIKRSNAMGLLTKTVLRLSARAEEGAPGLDEAEARLVKGEREVTSKTLKIVQERLFAESHLWTFAMGREMGLRAKGIVGSLFRLVEALRGLPARMAGWLPRLGAAKTSAGRGAASLLSSKELFHDDLEIATEAVAGRYQAEQSEIALAFARAGFDIPHDGARLAAFREALNHRVSEVLRGPARDSVIRHARLLTGWLPSLAADLPPLAFFAFAGYKIVASYFTVAILPMSFLVHSAAVLAILLAVELLAISLITRMAAASARLGAQRALRAALSGGVLAFEDERRLLETTQKHIEEIRVLRKALEE